MPPGILMNPQQPAAVGLSVEGQHMAPHVPNQQPGASLQDITLKKLLQMAGFDTAGFEDALATEEAQFKSLHTPAGPTATPSAPAATGAVASSAPGPSSSPPKLLHGVELPCIGLAVSPQPRPTQTMLTPPTPLWQGTTAALAKSIAAPEAAKPPGLPLLALRNPIYPFGPPPGVQQDQQQQQQQQPLVWQQQMQMHQGEGLQPPSRPDFNTQHSNLDQLAAAVMSLTGNSLEAPPVVKRKRGRPRKNPLPSATFDEHTQPGTTTAVGAAGVADEESVLQTLLQQGDVDAAALPRELLEQQQRILDSCRQQPRKATSSGEWQAQHKTAYTGAPAAAAAAALDAGSGEAAAGAAGAADVGAARNKKPRTSYGWYLLQQAQLDELEEGQSHQQQGQAQGQGQHPVQQQQQSLRQQVSQPTQSQPAAAAAFDVIHGSQAGLHTAAAPVSPTACADSTPLNSQAAAAPESMRHVAGAPIWPAMHTLNADTARLSSSILDLSASREF